MCSYQCGQATAEPFLSTSRKLPAGSLVAHTTNKIIFRLCALGVFFPTCDVIKNRVSPGKKLNQAVQQQTKKESQVTGLAFIVLNSIPLWTHCVGKTLYVHYK